MSESAQEKEFFLNSYPRTGSTFLKVAVNKYLDVRIFEQVHSALLAGKNVENTLQVIVAREPIGAITSNVYREFGEYKYKNSLDRPQQQFEEFFDDGLDYSFDFHNRFYNQFYTNALKNENALVVFFEDFSVDIRSTLKEIHKGIGQKLLPIQFMADTETMKEEIFKDMGKSPFHSLTTMTSGNLPREKSDEYPYIKAYVERQTKEIEECMSIYELLRSKKNMI